MKALKNMNVFYCIVFNSLIFNSLINACLQQVNHIVPSRSESPLI